VTSGDGAGTANVFPVSMGLGSLKGDFSGAAMLGNLRLTASMDSPNLEVTMADLVLGKTRRERLFGLCRELPDDEVLRAVGADSSGRHGSPTTG
jgi:hypothetical protein